MFKTSCKTQDQVVKKNNSITFFSFFVKGIVHVVFPLGLYEAFVDIVCVCSGADPVCSS